MTILEIIEKKKHGIELSKSEIDFVITNFTIGNILDYQMSAFLMAIYFKGLSSKETSYLTLSMLNSGQTYDFKGIKGLKVDKHSTGGVGDKVSLILGPIIAALGINFVKMSGRALGFTGGTIDKLESIPGFRVDLTKKEIIAQVKKIKMVIISQSEKIVPADKKIYALRDVTGTIDSLPLIVASIMSKKLAMGTDAILLDVKCGNGAFMKTQEEATNLAKAMVAIGNHLKKDVRVEITSMDQPLGRTIGNRIEVLEAVEFLDGKGSEDLLEVVYSSAATILLQAKKVKSKNEAKILIKEVIESKKALNIFKKWIESQGANFNSILNPDFFDPKFKKEIKASKDGFVHLTSAINFGLASLKLGAGRNSKTEQIDNKAGIYLNKKTNEMVKKGETILTLYSSKTISLEVVDLVKKSYRINVDKVAEKMILKTL